MPIRCFLSVLFMLLLLSGCAGQTPVLPEEEPAPVNQPDVPPLSRPGFFRLSHAEAVELSRALSPARQGLGSWTDMRFAVSQSLAHVSSRPAGKVAIHMPDEDITYGDMARALRRLESMLPSLDRHPEQLATAFRWYRVGPDFGFTGYYEPELLASPVRTERFTHPLYRTPPDMKKVKRRRGRYYSRHEIDCKGVLRGRGLELAWIEQPVDAFILQIQGSGRLRYEDGSVRSILYAGQNGHKYVALGRVMVDRGLLKREEVSMEAIRDWLLAHPDQQSELMDTNPSYVFFRLGPNKGSYGSMGRILTPWVSVATDQSVLPNGLLTMMHLALPDEQGHLTVPFNALLLPQDTGGAIRNNRVDIFCGNGPWAKHTASHLDTGGAVFLLLP